MTKNTALVMTLDLLKSKKTVTPAEINKHVGKGNYASKYICYLKNRGHNIETTKQGREIVGYKYLGLNGSTQRVKRASQRGTVNTASVPVKEKKVQSKKEKKVSGKGKPVMSKEEIKKAAAAIHKMRQKNQKNEVEKVLTASVPASSYSIDTDWDNVDNINKRDLGL